MYANVMHHTIYTIIHMLFYRLGKNDLICSGHGDCDDCFTCVCNKGIDGVRLISVIYVYA